jgi:hypothetical protein
MSGLFLLEVTIKTRTILTLTACGEKADYQSATVQDVLTDVIVEEDTKLYDNNMIVRTEKEDISYEIPVEKGANYLEGYQLKITIYSMKLR